MLITIAVRALETMFVVGLIGSAIVVILTSFEDFATLFKKDNGAIFKKDNGAIQERQRGLARP